MAIPKRKLGHRRARLGTMPEVRSTSFDGTGSFTGAFSIPTLSGSTVNEQTAMTVTAVWQAVHIYANTIGALDLYVAERDKRGGSRPAFEHPTYDLVHTRPNRITTSFRFRQSLIAHALTHGNGYAEIERLGNQPVALHLIDPRNVRPTILEDGRLVYHLVKEGKDVAARDMVHIAGLGWDGIKGYSAITFGREAIGVAIAQQAWEGALYGNSAVPNGYLKYPGTLKQDTKDRLRDNWNKEHQGADRSNKIAVFDAGLEWVATSFSPEDAQLILSRGFSIAEIARLFNLPQHMLGQMEHSTFGNIEEQNIQFYQLSLMPWLVNIEQELNLKLFSAAERKQFFVRHDINSLLRGNIAAQTARDVAMFNIGVYSQNEIRLAGGENPIDSPSADKHWVPINNLRAIEDLDKVAVVPLAESDPDATEAPTTVDPAVVTTPAPAPAPTAPTPTDTVVDPAQDADAADIQATALNGAQIASLMAIVSAVASGVLPAESAKGLIAASFPTLSPAKIETILGPLDGFASADPSAVDRAALAPGEIDALRGLLADPIDRMIRRECIAVRKASRRPDFLEWLDEFYAGHHPLLDRSTAPAFRAINVVRSSSLDGTAITAAINRESREHLAGIVKSMAPDEIPGAVDRLCTEWESTRAESLARRLIHD